MNRASCERKLKVYGVLERHPRSEKRGRLEKKSQPEFLREEIMSGREKGPEREKSYLEPITIWTAPKGKGERNSDSMRVLAFNTGASKNARKTACATNAKGQERSGETCATRSMSSSVSSRRSSYGWVKTSRNSLKSGGWLKTKRVSGSNPRADKTHV